MAAWLIIGVVVTVLVVLAAMYLWQTGASGAERSSRIDIAISPGTGGTPRTTSVRGRNISCTLRLTNSGSEPATVEDVFLDVPGGWRVKMNVSYDGGSLLQGDRPLPCRLGAGESVSFGIPRNVLRQELHEMGVGTSNHNIRVEVRDVADRLHTAEFAVEDVSG